MQRACQLRPPCYAMFDPDGTATSSMLTSEGADFISQSHMVLERVVGCNEFEVTKKAAWQLSLQIKSPANAVRPLS